MIAPDMLLIIGMVVFGILFVGYVFWDANKKIKQTIHRLSKDECR